MVRKGPQPYEAQVSEICEAFGCPPDVAERQDPRLVRAVIDYRNAKQAIAWFNDGERGQEQLAKYPELGTLLLELVRAQGGAAATVDEQRAESEE